MKAAKSQTGQALVKSAKKSARRAAVKTVARALKGENVVEGAKSDIKEAKKRLANTLEKSVDDNEPPSKKGKRIGIVVNNTPVIKKRKKRRTKFGKGSLI